MKKANRFLKDNILHIAIILLLGHNGYHLNPIFGGDKEQDEIEEICQKAANGLLKEMNAAE